MSEKEIKVDDITSKTEKIKKQKPNKPPGKFGIELELIKKKLMYMYMEIKIGINSTYTKNSAKIIGSICAVILLFLAIATILFHQYGKISVQLTDAASRKGIYLSDSKGGENSWKTRLFTNKVDHCDNINIQDIPKDIHTNGKEGIKNGEDYIAYSFHIGNGGTVAAYYKYGLRITNVTRKVDEAIWFMIFEEDKADIYAKGRDDGTPERQYRYGNYWIEDHIGSKKDKYITKLSATSKSHLTSLDIKQLGLKHTTGLQELQTKPFITDKEICIEDDKKIKPGEEKNYTLVVWLEGEDYQCIDDIKGGSIGFEMVFDVVEYEDERQERLKAQK